MRSGNWKILAVLPVAVFASSAFGTTVGGNPSLPSNYPTTVDWEIGAILNGVPSGTQGIASGQNDLNFWQAVLDNHGVATFTNPSGPGVAKLISPDVSGSVYAKAPSMAPPSPNPEGWTNYTSVAIGWEGYVQVICHPESPGDLCGHFTRLPLFFDGNYALSGAGGDYGAENQVSVTVGGTYEFTKNCADGCSSGLFTGTINVRPGEILHWGIGAGAYSQNGGPTGYAYVDPYFYLSPAEVAAGYSLVFSEFVGNAPPAPVSGSAVPEPGSLMLFGTGVLAVVITMRRWSARR